MPRRSSGSHHIKGIHHEDRRDAPQPLLDAVVRLLRLLDSPRDNPVLAPLIKREILWWLIAGEQGSAPSRTG